MHRNEEIAIKRELKRKYGDTVSDRRIFYLGHPRVLDNPFYEETRKHPGTIIDEACGCGDDTRQFLKDGFSPIGVDMNQSGFELGFEYYKLLRGYNDKNKIGSLLHVGDVTRMEFPSNSFRYSYSGSLIHYLPNESEARAYLSEVYRILESGGLLFGETIGKKRGEKADSLVLLTKDELASFLEDAGMRVKSINIHYREPLDITGYNYLSFKDPPMDMKLRFLAEKP